MSLEENLIKIANMPEKEKAEFKRLANYLMTSTFLLRDDVKHMISKDYLFVERRIDLYEDYLSLIGWRIYRDRQYGVIYVLNEDNQNKIKLDKLTTVIMITIRIIYEEKRVLASSSNDVITTVSEIISKIVNDFSVYKKQPTQQERKDSFRILEKHNLIYKLGESFTDYECRLIVFPSILFAVSNEKCKSICDTLALEKEESSDEEDEQAAADQLVVLQ